MALSVCEADAPGKETEPLGQAVEARVAEPADLHSDGHINHFSGGDDANARPWKVMVDHCNQRRVYVVGRSGVTGDERVIARG